MDYEESKIKVESGTDLCARRSLRTRTETGVVPGAAPNAQMLTRTLIVFSISPEKLEEERQRVAAKEGKKVNKKPPRPKLPSSGNPKTNKYNFEFGHDNWPECASPTLDEIQTVVDILAKERKVLIKKAMADGESSMPFHAAWNVTVDSILRVLISQRTDNEEAMELQQRLRQAYPYFVNGKRVYGKKPNYHAMRVQGAAKLFKLFGKTGLGKIKSDAMIEILNNIFEHNVAKLKEGEVVYAGNFKDAPDFVPGLLSVDFISDILKKEGKQGVFDCLVKWHLIGPKTAACIMAFNMGIPVFPVDTHVSNMAKILG
jgi:endonuclease III